MMASIESSGVAFRLILEVGSKWRCEGFEDQDMEVLPNQRQS